MSMCKHGCVLCIETSIPLPLDQLGVAVTTTSTGCFSSRNVFITAPEAGQGRTKALVRSTLVRAHFLAGQQRVLTW